MSIVETFHGYIQTTQDTLLIFEACRRGLLPRICRRLQEKERRIVQSGTVFVFDERESGIKRWTDGLVWSPSRILENFLVYRELDKRNASGKKDASPIDRASRSSSSSDVESALEKNKERALVGSLTNSYRFKKNGLIKKTMSIVVNGISQHLISYYTKEDVLSGKLRTPSSVPELAGLEISPEFLLKQNFRIPPLLEHNYDMNEHIHSPVSNHSPRTPNGAPFHIGANGADFTSTAFNNHVRPKAEGDMAGASAIEIFQKPYHHQQHAQYQSGYHTQSGYHAMGHMAGQHHHASTHQYSPQHATFPATSLPMNGASQDPTPSTPPPLRYISQGSNQRFVQYPQQASQTQAQQHQRHSISPSPYGSGSPSLVMPSPSASSEFNLSMGYHSNPSPNGANGFSSIPGTQAHGHQAQGWSEFSYQYSGASAALGQIPDHNDQHHDHSASP